MALRDIIARHVDGWIVKRDFDASPRRIEATDIDDLSAAIASCGLGARTEAEDRLSESLEGWVVQRARGERPSALNDADFATLLDLVSTAPGDGDIVGPEARHAVDPDVSGRTEGYDSHSGQAEEHDAMLERESANGMVPAVDTPAKVSRHAAPRRLPEYNLMQGLELARFHIEQGV
ncbi:hypothetical protein [Asaia krungthepensis]|uniref:Uncharacterized protein n=1 Tax=Asaia krungthepensis NRIC 0535 TaxID=1307925 RepID=A0ABQ0PXK1_9PROT|nr:hypothetical protein [Asaia krungthepensis]GBQ84061.1 hypothetical protein AA0535_0406 [Asaia krungthepensis NRIC 0535]